MASNVTVNIDGDFAKIAIGRQHGIMSTADPVFKLAQRAAAEYERLASRTWRGALLASSVRVRMFGDVVATVTSSGRKHSITRSNGRLACDCQDFRRMPPTGRDENQPLCKHLIAYKFKLALMSKMTRPAQAVAPQPIAETTLEAEQFAISLEEQQRWRGYSNSARGRVDYMWKVAANNRPVMAVILADDDERTRAYIEETAAKINQSIRERNERMSKRRE